MPSNASPKVVEFPRRAKHARHPRWHAAFALIDGRVSAIERQLAGNHGGSLHVAEQSRIRYALIGSVLVHLAVLFGFTFKIPDKSHFEDPNAKLEVVLVNAKTTSAPKKADALAQHNLDGGGNTSDKHRATSPLPVLKEAQSEPEVKLALKRVENLERQARELITVQKSKTPVETAPSAAAPITPPVENDPQAAPHATDIMQRSLEIARLEAKISRDWHAYQERPRRRFVGARTQEYRFARYVEDWRQKIERIGELNYPQAARDQKLSGSLVVTVAIRSDGTVEQVDINRPSGIKVLDDATRRIVQLAAPFSPFPENIAKDTDILHITRTWTFTRADRFVSTD